MAASNHRIKAYDTVHHLMSRIAHSVYMLEEDQRNDFLEYVRRVTDFCGLTLIGWCVMTNHFHLLVYLPQPEKLDEGEILRRYGVLKGLRQCAELEGKLAAWHAKGGTAEGLVSDVLGRLQKRMYSVAEYMRMIKQWFSEEYNSRNAHKGTLWSAVYQDRPVPKESDAMRQVLGYIHLNPVRAAITDRFDDYVWSSFTAFRRGEPLAAKGMRFVYGDALTNAEIAHNHEILMRDMLEEEKRRRAAEIVRRRAAGFVAPCDPLTSEALVEQATALQEEVQREITALHEAREAAANKLVARALAEKQILDLLKLEPLTTTAVARRLQLPERTARRYLTGLRALGAVSQASRFAPWQLTTSGR